MSSLQEPVTLFTGCLWPRCLRRKHRNDNLGHRLLHEEQCSAPPNTNGCCVIIYKSKPSCSIHDDYEYLLNKNKINSMSVQFYFVYSDWWVQSMNEKILFLGFSQLIANTLRWISNMLKGMIHLSWYIMKPGWGLCGIPLMLVGVTYRYSYFLPPFKDMYPGLGYLVIPNCL